MIDDRKPWWMVLNPFPEGGKPSFRHETEAAAILEATRLANMTGKKIHVLKLVGSALPPAEHSKFFYREGGEK